MLKFHDTTNISIVGYKSTIKRSPSSSLTGAIAPPLQLSYHYMMHGLAILRGIPSFWSHYKTFILCVLFLITSLYSAIFIPFLTLSSSCAFRSRQYFFQTFHGQILRIQFYSDKYLRKIVLDPILNKMDPIRKSHIQISN